MSEFLTSGTFRRLVLTLTGIAVVALNKKLELGLDTADTGEIALLIIAAVTGSNLKETAQVKAIAASGQVNTLADAAKVVSADIAAAPEVKP